MYARCASPEDAATITHIYNQGIGERSATFETRLRTESEIRTWFDGVHPVVCVAEANQVVAFAATSAYRPRDCYRGIAEASVYVDPPFRRLGAGRLALRHLMEAAAAAGYWKLVSRIFVENYASRRLVASLGFREVGIYQKHAKLAGIWRDVVIVEKLLSAGDSGSS
jgi:phosphinothricin acetyltransferase